MTEHLGFHSVSEQVDESLPVRGTLPDWLDGTMYRNGPGSFETGDDEVDHWFDGLAMVRAFEFDDETVRLRTRFLETDAYRQAQEGSFAGFASGGAGLLRRLKAFLFDPPYDNTNIVVERIGDEYVALTETPRWTRIDPETLSTHGPVERNDDTAGDIACAHVHHDPWSGEVLTFETAFGRQPTYHLYAYETPIDRRQIASLPVDEPAYMHSFAATEQYVLLTEFPFVVSPMDFLKPGTMSFVDAFRWEPDRGLRIRVVDRDTGAVVATPVAESRFGFHHVNAYEPDGEGTPDVVFDLETVPDAGSLDELSLDRLRSGEYETPMGRLRRYELTIDDGVDGGARVDSRRLYDGGTGLPVVSPARRFRQHRYVYGQGGSPMATDWPRSIVKLDIENGSARTYDPDAYVNEPLFVPAPSTQRDGEDDGVVLVVVLDDEAGTSRLVVLDGKTLAERAVVALPVALPIGFHGRYLTDEGLFVPSTG